MAKKDKQATPEANAEGEAVSNDTVLKWGDNYSVDLATLPQSSLIALAQRGFTHILGNEVASAISARKKDGEGEGEAFVAKYNDAELEVIAHDMRNAKIAAMVGGTLGVRVGAPRMSSIDKMVRDIAIAELKAVAVAKGKTFPRKADEYGPLVDARLAHDTHGPRIRAKAQAQLDELKALSE